MTGQLESIDAFKSIVRSALEAGVGPEEVSFTASCVRELQMALPATDRKRFRVDHYLIQWNSPNQHISYRQHLFATFIHSQSFCKICIDITWSGMNLKR